MIIIGVMVTVLVTGVARTAMIIIHIGIAAILTGMIIFDLCGICNFNFSYGKGPVGICYKVQLYRCAHSYRSFDFSARSEGIGLSSNRYGGICDCIHSANGLVRIIIIESWTLSWH